MHHEGGMTQETCSHGIPLSESCFDCAQDGPVVRLPTEEEQRAAPVRGEVEGVPFTVTREHPRTAVLTHRGWVDVERFESPGHTGFRATLRPGTEPTHSEKIEPALTLEEWRATDRAITEPVGALPERADDVARLIALANAALPDSDPRKITRETVTRLRALADRLTYATDESQEIGDGYPADVWQSDALRDGIAFIRRHADALESYLPPER